MKIGQRSGGRKQWLILLLLTLGALLVHGYHPAAEDAEIYLPGIEKILHPELFPFNAQFFEPYTRLSMFAKYIAYSVRVAHVPLSGMLLVWQLASIFMLLSACWQLSGKCFQDPRARWAGVALVAALLTLPVAGTSLYIMDQYINPRQLSAFSAVFAIARVLDRKYGQALLWLVFAATVHPLMMVYAASYSILLIRMKRSAGTKPCDADTGTASAWAGALPFGNLLAPPSKAYHQAALYHSFHFILSWRWYEWVGILAPVVLLWWFSRLATEKGLTNLRILCRALILYDLAYFAAALLISIPARFESVARIQPLRSLHLLYILLFLFMGCLLGQYALQDRRWRWIGLFAPLAVAMFVAQRATFPASAHIEWPGQMARNHWTQAFVWVRQNTPNEAIFALDPEHLRIAGEDAQGFRAIAERSMLADALKDSGAVTMFPFLADDWLAQVQAQSRWKQFGIEDFRRLKREYGVSWVLVEAPALDLDCPYHNPAVAVCRVP